MTFIEMNCIVHIRTHTHAHHGRWHSNLSLTINLRVHARLTNSGSYSPHPYQRLQAFEWRLLSPSVFNFHISTDELSIKSTRKLSSTNSVRFQRKIVHFSSASAIHIGCVHWLARTNRNKFLPQQWASLYEYRCLFHFPAHTFMTLLSRFSLSVAQKSHTSCHWVKRK
jgi:hypothetical protein